jgi:D-amino peptidase
MRSDWLIRRLAFLTLALAVAIPLLRSAPSARSKKAYVITDLEGVDGIFDLQLQCEPYESPRFEESRKLLTGELNAAVNGLFEGGATEVVVLDGHDSSRTLSVADLDPRVRLLQGQTGSPNLLLDSSYGALVFIGRHALAGAEKGILNHSHSSENIQNFWINGMPSGEIGLWVRVAGAFGIPTIMLSGDTAACKEVLQLSPQAECAEVKSGVSRTAGFMLSHPAACALIREKSRRAMERLEAFRPFDSTGPAEIKVEFTTVGARSLRPREGVEQLNSRMWVFRGKDILDALNKWSGY